MRSTRCAKHRYRTELGAKLALFSTRLKEDRDEQRYYACKRCSGWHLTSEELRPGNEPTIE